MTLELVCWAISVAIYIGFSIVFAIIKFGVPPSVSSLYRKLDKIGWPPWLYSLAMMYSAMFLAVAGGTNTMGWAAMFLVVTGIAGDTSQGKVTEWLHIVGAWGCMALGLLALWVDYGYWILSIFGLALILAIWIPRLKNKTYWIENAAYFVVAFGILNHLIYLDIFHGWLV
ncbi:MAG: hypothetical protein KGY70_11475 [Bacteroidales bacterium]|nr:hypothetical protein [Bacteroidales bacterium]